MIASAPRVDATAVGPPLAPPIPNETAFYCRFFAEVSSIRDTAGRPLHEVDFRSELTAQGIRRCPWHDSRKGQKLNWEALQIITAEWQQILDGMRWLLWSTEIDQTGRGPGEANWTRALLPMFLPLYLHWRSDKGPEQVEMATAVSGLFKIMLDVPTTLDLMLATDWSGVGDCAYTAAGIGGYAERTGILNNHDWACASPPGLIRAALTTLCGDADEPTSDPPVPWGFPLDGFAAFAGTMARQYALSQAFQVGTTFAMESAFSHLGGGQAVPDGPAKLLSAYERRRRILLDLCRDPTACQEVVDRFLCLSRPTDRQATGGVLDACGSELLRLVQVRGKRPAEILETQGRVEDLMRSCVQELRGQCWVALGKSVAGTPKVNFSCLDAGDFPSRVLRRRLEESH